MQKRPTTIATPNHAPGKLNQGYVSLWASVVSAAVSDLKNGKSGSASSFFTSGHFKSIASLCGLDYDSAMAALQPYLQKPADAPECPVQAAPGVDGAMTPPMPKKRLGRPPRDPNAPPKPKYVPKPRPDNTIDFELITTVGDAI